MIMETAGTEARKEERTETRARLRSSVLNQMRLNPFHVLRLPLDAGVDEAIWKAEEALTLGRAGLAMADLDVFPWLPAAEEQEIRQAVRSTEEPLRRVLEQLFWFDFKADPQGESLQRALAALDVKALENYLAIDPGENVVLQMNRANLHLLLAALALADRLPKDERQAEAPATAAFNWEKTHGLSAVRNPHDADLTGGRHRRELEKAVVHWRGALTGWVQLSTSPMFLEHLKACLVRLGDDLIGEEDCEALLNSLLTRLTDLVAGEVKIQILDGRFDRVRAILEVASSSGIPMRRWSLAFRPLRPLFQTELAELDVFISETQSLRLEDVELYLQRLKALSERWTELDPTGMLALAEFIDGAANKVGGVLSSHLEYGAAPALNKLYESAAAIADAGSVKHRISTSMNRLKGQELWLCHFCSAREADVNCSATLEGKKETHRTHGFNSTTIHYAIKRNIVQRCQRCAKLHGFVRSTGMWAWLGLLPLFVLIAVFNFELLIILPWPVIWVVAFVLIYIALGFCVRRITAMSITPKGERGYHDVKSAKQYQALQAEGFGITLDFSPNAFKKMVENK